MDFNKIKKLRLDRNKLIVTKLKKGESLTAIPAEQTFFPPRPVIKKDPEAIRRIYEQPVKNK